MTDTITAGSILVQEGGHLPKSLLLQTGPDSHGWATVQDPRAAFVKTVEAAGLAFFFMAGEIKATVFGFDRQKALRTARKRLIANVKSQHCNSIEITQVVGKSFLRVPYVTVSAHPRHLQHSILFAALGKHSGPDAELVSQTKSEWKATIS